MFPISYLQGEKKICLFNALFLQPNTICFSVHLRKFLLLLGMSLVLMQIRQQTPEWEEAKNSSRLTDVVTDENALAWPSGCKVNKTKNIHVMKEV